MALRTRERMQGTHTYMMRLRTIGLGSQMVYGRDPRTRSKNMTLEGRMRMVVSVEVNIDDICSSHASSASRHPRS